jgi:hypothetical protein
MTAFDKAIVAILVPILAWVNQKYGLTIDASPETLTVVVGFISSVAVYVVPNKAPAQ